MDNAPTAKTSSYVMVQLTDPQLADLLNVRRDLGILEARTEERFKANLQALNLQAREYERRLDHLNGEQARVKEERSLLGEQLRREMELGFTASHNEMMGTREILLSFIAEQRGINKGIGLMWTVVIAVMTLSLAGFGVWFAKS